MHETPRQANTLDTLFTSLTQRAAGANLNELDNYLRLALKAQSQCRVTLETLAAIKNPPIIFAKQANIAHGHQQVNNDSPRARGRSKSVRQEPRKAQTKLLEQQTNELQRMDTRATGKAGRGNQTVAAVAAVSGECSWRLRRP